MPEGGRTRDDFSNLACNNANPVDLPQSPAHNLSVMSNIAHSFRFYFFWFTWPRAAAGLL